MHLFYYAPLHVTALISEKLSFLYILTIFQYESISLYLLVNLRGWCCRANSLIAEELVRRRLIVIISLIAVENILMMIATIFVIVVGVRLARLHRGERGSRLIVLRITGGVLLINIACWGCWRLTRTWGCRGRRTRCARLSRGHVLLLLLLLLRVISRLRGIVIIFFFVKTKMEMMSVSKFKLLNLNKFGVLIELKMDEIVYFFYRYTWVCKNVN